MKGFFEISNIVLVLTIVLVIVGAVFALFWYFKRADQMTAEDRVNIERAKLAWIGAAALGVLILVASKKERGWNLRINGLGGEGPRASTQLY